MARINLYGNTTRAVMVSRELMNKNHSLCIVTTTPENGEPTWKFEGWGYQPYNDDCDVILAVNWRLWIPESVCAKARYGAYCLHDSLLPNYRGRSPVVWAVSEGAKETGVTLFRMEKDYDVGPIIGQRRRNIEGFSLQQAWDSLTPLYVDLIQAHLPAILDGTVVEYPQDPATIQPARPKKEWPK